MQKSIILIFITVSTVCFAQTPALAGDVKKYNVIRHDKNYFIRLQNNNDIGRVEYNETLKKYVSFAFFPFHIPYSHRRTVREFLAELTKTTKLPGRYYIDMSCGEFGYYELSSTPVWNPRDVYKIWPEIYRIISTNARVSTVLKTIHIFPLSERTHGDLTKMKEIKDIDKNPGEFDYDSFSVEEDLLRPVPAKTTLSVTVDIKKINADFVRLLTNSKFPHHADLKKAAEKRDTETILQIADKLDSKSDEYKICILYAAIYGQKSAKENFASAERWFYKWEPELMMSYLQKAVEARLPEAEHFLGQYLYRFDLGTPEEIFNLWQRAYKGGEFDAGASLARYYWFGFGTERNQRKAFEIAKQYLAKVKEPAGDSCFYSIAKTIAGLGYLKFDKNKEKGLKLIHDPTTVQGVIAADCVYFYGLYGVPQSLGTHELEGGLQPHWAHLDVMEEGFRSKRDEKIIAIFEYQ